MNNFRGDLSSISAKKSSLESEDPKVQIRQHQFRLMQQGAIEPTMDYSARLDAVQASLRDSGNAYTPREMYKNLQETLVPAFATELQMQRSFVSPDEKLLYTIGCVRNCFYTRIQRNYACCLIMSTSVRTLLCSHPVSCISKALNHGMANQRQLANISSNQLRELQFA